MSKTQHVEKTSAEDKSIGFDYQYYYFLNELINLKQGQTVGLEVMDDVHSALSDNSQILVQLKYTTQTKLDGTPKNLATLDADFWKTLSNWSKVISDEHAGRKDTDEQLGFLSKTTFLLATNKADNENNTILLEIAKFQSEDSSFSSLTDVIKNAKSKAKDKVISQYIQDVLSLPESSIELLFQKMEFDLGCDEIIEKCKTSIAAHFIDPERIDDVFYSLDSQLRTDNFELVTAKKKIIISYDDFMKRYRIHFDKARNSALEIRRANVLPENLGEQMFIRQLIEIGDLEASEVDEVSRLSYHHLLAKNNVERWVQEGHATSLDVEAMEEEALTMWRNLFRKSFRGDIEEEEVNSLAQGIVDDLRMQKLTISQQALDLPFSNGEFYELCEKLKLGWRNDWEKNK